MIPPSRTSTFRSVLLALLLALVTPLGAGADPELDAVQQLAARGEQQTALDKLEPLIRERPDHVEALFLKGVILAQMGEIDRAIAIFEDLTTRFPDLSEPYNNLAVLYATKTEFDKARDVLLKAVALKPDYDTAFENLGDVYTKLAALAYERSYHIRGANARARAKHDILVNMLATPLPGATQPGVVRTDPGAAPASMVPVDGDRKPDCVLVGPLSSEDRTGAMTGWLEARGMKPQKKVRQGRVASAYRVYLPAPQSGESSERLLQELKESGLRDVAVIPRGHLRGGVSLGVYKQEHSVKKRLASVAGRGYSAKVQPLYKKAEQRWLLARSPVEGFDNKLFTQRFPDVPVKQGPCEH